MLIKDNDQQESDRKKVNITIPADNFEKPNNQPQTVKTESFNSKKVREIE